LPLSGLAGNNPASCREKNTPTPELDIRGAYADHKSTGEKRQKTGKKENNHPGP
jgi:hypothetical protein